MKSKKKLFFFKALVETVTPKICKRMLNMKEKKTDS